ncbi:MAG: hypothetical protein IKZ86_06955 [Spirochaetaceae bacterium]|nr:hypothetical protein [Spirochaetaceae bacterium]
MNKKNVFSIISVICFFLFMISFVLYGNNKIHLIYVLCILEAFLISTTIVGYIVLQKIKDDFKIKYKIEWFSLVITDFMLLLAIIGVLHDELIKQ